MLLSVYLFVMGIALVLSLVGWTLPATLLGGFGMLIAYRWHVLAAARRIPRPSPVAVAPVAVKVRKA